LGKLTGNPLAGLAALGLGSLGGPANSFNPAGKLMVKLKIILSSYNL